MNSSTLARTMKYINHFGKDRSRSKGDTADISQRKKISDGGGQNASVAIAMSTDDILSLILSFLSFHDLTQCINVSKTWNDAMAGVDDVSIDISNSYHTNHREYAQKLRLVGKSLGQNLKRLDIQCSKYVDDDVRDVLRNEILPKCNKLRYFSIRMNLNLGTMLEPLGKLSSLETLEINQCCFGRTEEFLLLLKNKPQLKILRLNRVTFGFPNEESIVTFYSEIGKLHSLRELVLKTRSVRCESDHQQCWHALFLKLNQLRVLEVNEIDDDALDIISKHSPHLHTLHAQNSIRTSMPGILKTLKACPIKILKIPGEVRFQKISVKDIRDMCQANLTLRLVGLYMIPDPKGVSGKFTFGELKDAALEDSNGRVNMIFRHYY